ncbi:MAG: peptidylprolyl isomerase [Gemmatimonadota bacterium]|nr:peptidylprolyl isomerase [Gemmatimonadota bacterium]
MRVWTGAALIALTACGGAEENGGDIVAEVGDEPITVDEVVEYMQASNRDPTREQVERSVEELIDLQLVRHRARATHELTPAESLQIEEWQETLLINQFREDVVWEEVEVDSAELREWYEENVGEEVRARHILIRVPPDASEEERAEARAKADSLRQAIVEGGTEFEEVAREQSQDPGSAARGGDLGWFGEGRMVEEFEQAAFDTPEGEITPVVETSFGFHIIEVTDKRKRSFEEMREEIEDQVLGPQRNEVTEAYVNRLLEQSGVEFYEENVVEVVRMIDEDRAPTEEERSLRLATFRDGGEILLGEIWSLYETLPEGNRRAIDRLDAPQMIQALSSIVQQRLLLARAREAEVVLDSARQQALDQRVDALYTQAYMREAVSGRLEVSDSVAREYYEGHREFYENQPYEEVEDQIKDVIRTQRMQSLNAPDAQREILAAVADSVEAVEVVRREDAYDEVVEELEATYEEEGRQPQRQPGTTRPRPTQQPARPDPAPPGGGAVEGADAGEGDGSR